MNVSTQHKNPAMQAAMEAIQRDARRTVIVAIKKRARVYIIQPKWLENVLGFIPVSPADVLTNAMQKLRELSPTRNFGFGGEVSAINLRAAILYARYARRFERTNMEI